jgi:SAM-dependent methyltransferase
MTMAEDPAAAAHWDAVYAAKPIERTSWYAQRLEASLAAIERHAPQRSARILDVGGGASFLARDLVAAGYRSIAVLDLSERALEHARRTLEDPARVEWRTGDVTTVSLPRAGYDVWHDRAVLHFLVDDDAAGRYAAQARAALSAGGVAIVGCFAPDGPERCSGLVVARRSADEVAALFGPAFERIEAFRETHVTPAGAEQRFAWTVLRRRDDAAA